MFNIFALNQQFIRYFYKYTQKYLTIELHVCHCLNDMGQAWTDLKVAGLNVAELKMAFLNQDGRTAETGIAVG